jgi:hypothetical protein
MLCYFFQAGFYAYFVVLFEYGLRPGYLVGLDDHNVFGYSKDEDVVDNAYFLWCFDDADYPCIYGPKEFDCNWIDWDEPWEPYKDADLWKPKSAGSGVRDPTF